MKIKELIKLCSERCVSLDSIGGLGMGPRPQLAIVNDRPLLTLTVELCGCQLFRLKAWEGPLQIDEIR